MLIGKIFWNFKIRGNVFEIIIDLGEGLWNIPRSFYEDEDLNILHP